MESSGEDTIKTVFVDTNLDTHFATTVSDSDTVYDLKRKVILGHHHCFPTIGAIKIDGLKIKRKGKFYHLSDRMMLKSVLAANKNYWFISVDASCLEQDIGIQLVDQHMEEDRHFKNEMSSKKRILDVQNESLLQDATRPGPSVREWILLRSSGVPASAFVNRVLIPSAVKSGIVERLTPTKVVEETTKKETTLLDALTNVSVPVEEIVQHEVPSENSPKEKLSSSIRGSDCEHVAPALGHLIGAKGDLAEKDLLSAIQIDNHKEDKQYSLKHQPELELSGRKKRVKKHAENDEVLENRSEDDVGMQEVEISKAAEVMEETSNKELKDVGRAEKNIGQGNEDGCDEKSEKENEKTDVEKKKKRKKKTGTSFNNGEVGVCSALSDPPLNDHVNEHENTLLSTAKKDNDEVKVNDAQVSGEGLVTGLEDLSSKRRATQQPDNGQSTDRHDNTSLGNSSSSGDGASSIDSRRNGYSVVERKEVVGKDKTNSQNKLKNMSMTELPRSSRRLKKAKISASQEQEDTESDHVEFVPESPPMTYV